MSENWVLRRIEGLVDDVARLRRSDHADWPRHVHLETLAVCNAACHFCPYPTLDRKGTRLSSSVIL